MIKYPVYPSKLTSLLMASVKTHKTKFMLSVICVKIQLFATPNQMELLGSINDNCQRISRIYHWKKSTKYDFNVCNVIEKTRIWKLSMWFLRSHVAYVTKLRCSQRKNRKFETLRFVNRLQKIRILKKSVIIGFNSLLCKWMTN